MKKSLLFITIFLFAFSGNAQDTTFYRTDASTILGKFFGSIRLADDSYILVGYRNFSGHEPCAIRIDKNGNALWSNFYTPGGGHYVDGLNIIQTIDGNFMICGGYGNAALLKIDISGNLIWAKDYTSVNISEARDVIETTDGDLFFAGYYQSTSAISTANIELTRTDSNGNRKWSRRYGSAGFDGAYCIKLTSDNKLLFAGTSTPTCGVILKTDTSGAVIWQKTVDLTHSIRFIDVQENEDGEYIFTGTYYDSPFNTILLYKTDTNGNALRSNIIYGNKNYYCHSAYPTIDGGMAITGYTVLGTTNRGFLLKTDATMNHEWCQEYTSTGNYLQLGSVVQASDGGYLLSGHTKNDTSGYTTLAFLKTNPLGILDCYTSPLTVSDSILVLPDSNPVLTYTTINPTTSAFYSKVPFTDPLGTYCSSVGIEEQAENNVLIFPNPVTDHFEIVMKEQITAISFSDISGKELNVKIKDNKIDCTTLTNGIYFIGIQTEKTFYKKKVIVIDK